MDNKETYLENIKQQLEKYAGKLSQIKDDIKHKTSKSYQASLDSSEQGLKEATKAYEKLKSATEENWEQLKESTSQMFQNLAQSFKPLGDRSLENSSHYAQQLEKEISTYVKNKPLVSSLIALGVGFVLGKMFK